jgi:hypothetical protein
MRGMDGALGHLPKSKCRSFDSAEKGFAQDDSIKLGERASSQGREHQVRVEGYKAVSGLFWGEDGGEGVDEGGVGELESVGG